MALTIRPLKSEDRTRWEPLWQGYLRFYETRLPDDVTETTWHKLLDPSRSPHGLVAVDGEKNLIGLVHYIFHQSTWTIPHICYLQDLFVDPGVRGKGAGRALIEAVYEKADEAGAAQVYWLTQEFNATARALYDKVATLTPFVRYRRQV
ncbi:MAG: N-acetyltransferase family protein [Parvibaculaceae bacterium]